MGFTMNDCCLALWLGEKYLNEMSFSRLLSHIKGSKQYVLVTYYRSRLAYCEANGIEIHDFENDRKIQDDWLVFNAKNKKEFLDILKETHKPYIKVEGVFEGSQEPSYLVFNPSFEQCFELAGKGKIWEQDSFLYYGPESEWKPTTFVTKTGAVNMKFNKITTDVIKDYLQDKYTEGELDTSRANPEAEPALHNPKRLVEPERLKHFGATVFKKRPFAFIQSPDSHSEVIQWGGYRTQYLYGQKLSELNELRLADIQLEVNILMEER
jgi:hypothetical protein